MSDLNRFQKESISKNITHTIVVKAYFGILTGDDMVRKSEKVEPLSIKKIEPLLKLNYDEVFLMASNYFLRRIPVSASNFIGV